MGTVGLVIGVIICDWECVWLLAHWNISQQKLSKGDSNGRLVKKNFCVVFIIFIDEQHNNWCGWRLTKTFDAITSSD